MALSQYESTALAAIHAWKRPQPGWLARAIRVVNWPLDKAGDIILMTPGVGDAITRSIQGLTSVCNDVAQWSINPASVYVTYNRAGHSTINKSSDISLLDLEEVDKVIGWLSAKYKGLTLVEGAGTGAIGLFGIAPDIVALITLNLRAIGEYATYCGFDISSQEERLFAMNVLSWASSPKDAAKGVAMAQLARIAKDVAKKRAWQDLEKQAFVKLMQKLAKSLGIRLTKAKLAQSVPVAGALVGGGFNAYYTSKVCDAAFYLYRERFLAEKYGPDVIEGIVEPVEDTDPDDLEDDEDDANE